MGQVIESLFFYGKTTVHLGRVEIRQLFDLTDVDTLQQLLKHPGLSVLYKNSHAAVGNQNDSFFVDTVGLSNLDLEKELYEETYAYKGNESQSRKFAKKISKIIGVHELPQYFNETIKQQLKDDEFLQLSVRQTLSQYYPQFTGDFGKIRYELEGTGNGRFIIHANFSSLGIPDHFTNSPILSLVTTCEDLQVTSELGAEISLPDFNSKMLQAKVHSVIQKSLKSQKEIDVFSHFVFDESWALREAINGKTIGIKPVLKVLEKADKFKSWISELDDDGNLMREYQEKVEEKSILETLPWKPIRFVLFNGLGSILSALNPEVGIPLTATLSGFDSAILDHLLKKWKPNQFVENEFRKLIR